MCGRLKCLVTTQYNKHDQKLILEKESQNGVTSQKKYKKQNSRAILS